MALVSSKIVRAFCSPAPYVAWGVLTLVLALAGPFGTYVHCTLPVRIICFATMVGLCILWGVSVRAVVQHTFPRLEFIPASLLVIGASAVILPWPLAWLAPRLTQVPADYLPPAWELAFLIVVFGLATVAVRWTTTRQLRTREVKAPEAAVATGPRLIGRLEPELRGRLIRISGRDHYVDVVTERGKASLLLRLSDALSELHPIDGMQVHRSHWVSTEAIVRAEKTRNGYDVVLSDGSRVPVSRSRIGDLQSRGLIPA
jgi:hypothetical protein